MTALAILPPPPPAGYRPPWEKGESLDSATSAPTGGGRGRDLTPAERARRSRVRKAAPACPIRPGEPCTLCQAFVTGPQDCQTVRLVMEDPDLREILAQKRHEYNAQKKARLAGRSSL